MTVGVGVGDLSRLHIDAQLVSHRRIFVLIINHG